MSQICYGYAQQGKCKYGNACRFSHGPLIPISTTKDTTSQRRDICFQFAVNGSCKFGSSCRFAHMSKPQITSPAQEELHNYTPPVPQAVFVKERTVVNDLTPRCELRFRSFNQIGKPSGPCPYGNECAFRHYVTAADAGFTALHQSAFYGNYEQLAMLIDTSMDYTELLQQRTILPFTISWSEYDEVDRNYDHYQLTIRPGWNALDVAKTNKHHLDSDSPCRDYVVKFLLDSEDWKLRRQVCIRMLLHPASAKEILRMVREEGEQSVIHRVFA
jgi:hypothetical protein